MNRLRNTLLERRGKLAELLRDQASEIPIEKQHQVFGAIREIDLVLRTIEYLTEQDSQHSWMMEPEEKEKK